MNQNRAADALREMFSGELILPGDPGYDQTHHYPFHPISTWADPVDDGVRGAPDRVIGMAARFRIPAGAASSS